jgi:phospholipase C
MGTRRVRVRTWYAAGAGLLMAGLLAACSSGQPAQPVQGDSAHPSTHKTASVKEVAGGPTGRYVVPAGIHKIKHVIIIMQENRSFDSYFGTYPGADGIPMRDGKPAVCVPNPRGGCARPYHDRADLNGGGPHGEGNAVADVNGGKMNGFIQQRDAARASCHVADDPACAGTRTPDVMGYHTAAEIPNYWKYAENYVLDDHMFEPVKSWSLPDHLYMVSAWSARCKNRSPMSCVNNIVGPYGVNKFQKAVDSELRKGKASIDLAWTDITWLLYAHHVSWRYYVQAGIQPDCDDDDAETCAAVKQNVQTPGIWNPLPLFGDVQSDNPPARTATTRPPASTGARRTSRRSSTPR